MTAVVVPYTPERLERATVLSLPKGARYVRLDDSDGAYPRLLARLWSYERDFCIVEHDVVPPKGFVAELEDCLGPWCVYSPPKRPGLAWLGCVRFRASLMRAFPDAMTTAMSIDNDGDTPWNWRKVDVRIERVLRANHLAPHFHEPPAEHLHIYPTR